MVCARRRSLRTVGTAADVRWRWTCARSCTARLTWRYNQNRTPPPGAPARACTLARARDRLTRVGLVVGVPWDTIERNKTHDPNRYACGVTNDFIATHADIAFSSDRNSNFSARDIVGLHHGGDAGHGVHARFPDGCPTTEKIVYVVRTRGRPPAVGHARRTSRVLTVVDPPRIPRPACSPHRRPLLPTKTITRTGSPPTRLPNRSSRRGTRRRRSTRPSASLAHVLPPPFSLPAARAPPRPPPPPVA